MLHAITLCWAAPEDSVLGSQCVDLKAPCLLWWFFYNGVVLL